MAAIAELYNEHADKYPVMLVDVSDLENPRVPYEEFAGCLTRRPRRRWTSNTARS